MKLNAWGAPGFDLREFVSPSLFSRRGESSIWHIHPKLFTLCQFNKDFFSERYDEEVTVIINDWLWGGQYSESGWRHPASKAGSELSFHKGGLCSAADLKYRLKRTGHWIDADRIRDTILLHQELFMQAGLRAMESADFAPTWVHQDLRHTGLDHILIVKPAADDHQT